MIVHLGFKSQRRKKESEGIAAFPHERHNKLAQNCCAVKLDVICLLNGTLIKQNLVFQRNIRLCRYQISLLFSQNLCLIDYNDTAASDKAS